MKTLDASAPGSTSVTIIPIFSKHWASLFTPDTVRVQFTLYGCPSLVNRGFCKALVNQVFCKVAQIGEAEGARRRIAVAHVETRDTDWSSRANLTK